jgi:adenine deaminase
MTHSAAGAGILVGTDIGQPFILPGFSVHEEMALLVQAGLSPLQALQAATINPARAMGATDSLGTVSPGKLADLVLLTANPLENIQHTRRIAGVILDGRHLDRRALDELLSDAERSAAVAHQSRRPPGAGGSSVRSSEVEELPGPGMRAGAGPIATCAAGA